MTKRGILLCATGHPYYGRMAYNLALTIKAHDRKFPIAIMHNGTALNHLSDPQLDKFDYIIQLPDEVRATQRTKLLAAEYTPFEKTLMLDADMLWLPAKRPEDMFDELDGIDFTAITEGKASEPNVNYFFWASTDEMKAVYSLKEEVYQWRTEVMYFTEKGKAVLRRATEICNNPGLKSIMMFAYDVPDELGVNVACAEMGIKPHQYKWKPSYWNMINGPTFQLTPNELYSQYYLVSFGSNHVTTQQKQLHDTLVREACWKQNTQHVFPLYSKKDFLVTRDKM